MNAKAVSADDGKKCFVIMPISDVEGYPAGHFREVYEHLIKPSVEESGYECELATSTSSAHMIQLDVVTKVATADLCICDLSTSNPNVMFEYGIRQAFDKPTVLIKDNKTKRIFDLSGFRDVEYDASLRHSTLINARSRLIEAIGHTVAGRDDKGQIFSLVQLMKLTKASLPSGDVSPEIAKFQLLEAKIDRLSDQLDEQNRNETSKKIARALLQSDKHSLHSNKDIIKELAALSQPGLMQFNAKNDEDAS